MKASVHASWIALAALAIGLVDAALIAGSWFGARGAFEEIPPRLWLVAPLCWAVVALGFDTFEHAGNGLDVCRTAPGALLDRWSPWFASSVCNWNAS